jgi:hypothetical protein
MFTVHCARHGTHVLLTWENIVAVVNGRDGIELEWECDCGQPGRLVPPRRSVSTPA